MYTVDNYILYLLDTTFWTGHSVALQNLPRFEVTSYEKSSVANCNYINQYLDLEILKKYHLHLTFKKLKNSIRS